MYVDTLQLTLNPAFAKKVALTGQKVSWTVAV